jgi:hypothetical protein
MLSSLRLELPGELVGLLDPLTDQRIDRVAGTQGRITQLVGARQRRIQQAREGRGDLLLDAIALGAQFVCGADGLLGSSDLGDQDCGGFDKGA